MHKGKINFKQIRKKVIQQQTNENDQNIPMNPAYKVSFRGIKRQHDIPMIQIDSNSKIIPSYSPKRVNTMRSKAHETTREDCNKFSILLQSKGYSNCSSAKKKSDELSFRTLGNLNNSKYRVNTERSQIVPAKFEIQTPKSQTIQQKCRQIKNKNFATFKQNTCQLTSLGKLKSKLISPLKKKSESQPQPVSRVQEQVINIFEHSSILSEHDLVNMSKTNQSIDFDMSPCL